MSRAPTGSAEWPLLTSRSNKRSSFRRPGFRLMVFICVYWLILLVDIGSLVWVWGEFGVDWFGVWGPGVVF